MQPRQQVVTFVHRAVAVGVAQQRDQVAFRRGGVTAARRKGHDPAPDEILGAVFRLTLRRARLDHQHVTVGQRMDGARIDQVGGIGADRQPLGDGRRLAVGPAHDLGHVHARQRIDELRFGQDRIGTDLAGDVEPFGILRSGGHRHGKAKRQDGGTGQHQPATQGGGMNGHDGVLFRRCAGTGGRWRDGSAPPPAASARKSRRTA